MSATTPSPDAKAYCVTVESVECEDVDAAIVGALGLPGVAKIEKAEGGRLVVALAEGTDESGALRTVRLIAKHFKGSRVAWSEAVNATTPIL